jgi:preprotein translocase subunit SecG
MSHIITTIEIIISVLLITSILLQHRGTGLGSAFGGEGNVYRSRRGVEKLLHYFTIILAVLFVATALVALVVK